MEKTRPTNNLRKVQWVWVKGHAANLENKRCDKLARLAIKEKMGFSKKTYLNFLIQQEVVGLCDPKAQLLRLCKLPFFVDAL